MAEITQWEYKNVNYTDEKKLNELGAEGWETVAPVCNYNGGITTGFVMKRPKQAPRPAPSDGYGYGR